MNHSDTFLSKLLTYQRLDDSSSEVKDLVREVEDLKKLITDEFSSSSAIFREGGSKAKGTMVRCAYDYDLSVYADSESTAIGATLDDMADSIEKCLEKKYTIKSKTVALQVLMKSKDGDGGRIGADVVVGRYVDSTRADAYLAYHGSEKDRLKTNLNKHIEHVKNSGCIDIIRLMKIWKVARGLDEIKTFPMELATIKLLGEADAPKYGLSQRLYWSLDRLGAVAESMGIEDPANPSGNNIERFFGPSERKLLREQAMKAAKLAEGEGWEKVFAGIDAGESKSKAALLATGVSSIAPVRAWSD